MKSFLHRLMLNPLCAYLGLALLITLPLGLQFNHSFICAPVITDEKGHWLYSIILFEKNWLNWSLPQILAFPFEIVDHFNFLDIPLALLLKAWFGFPLFINLLTLICLALNGWAAYHLLRNFTGEANLAFALGICYAFSPLVLEFLSTSSIMRVMLFWIPWFIWYCFKLLNFKAPLNAVWAGILGGLVAITYWYYGMFCLVWLAVFTLYFYGLKPTLSLKRDFLVKIALTLLCFGMVVLPFISPLLQLEKQAFINPRFRIFALQSFKLYPSLDSLLKGEGKFEEEVVLNNAYSLEHLGDFPTIILYLAFVPLLWYRKTPQKFWLVVLGIFYLIGLGPYLKWNNAPIILDRWPMPSPLYFGLYFLVPGWVRLHFLSRIDLFIHLALILLAGFNLKALFQEAIPDKRTQNWILFACLGLWGSWLLQKNYLPLPLFQTREIPGFYRQLATQPPCRILELPFSSLDLEPRRKIYYLVHQHEQIDAVNDYLNGELPKALQRSELFAWLERLNAVPYQGGSLDSDKVKHILKINDIKYLVLDQNFYQLIYPKDNLGNRLYVQNYALLKSMFGTPVFFTPDFCAFKCY